jgi:putative transposase
MAQFRKEALVNDNYYHVFSRSIAGFVVFNGPEEYERICRLLTLYRYVDFDCRYSQFIRMPESYQQITINRINEQNNYLVEIVAYCLMPTHIHLLLKQTRDKGIVKFMARVLNGYARYFNVKHQRTGPLWSGRFKSVRIDADEQLLHVTRYIHLNPTSANLAAVPQAWPYSSYKEYIAKASAPGICRSKDIIDMSSKEYRYFVNDRQGYQRELALIKHLVIENYSG